jgi:hypothetical protein
MQNHQLAREQGSGNSNMGPIFAAEGAGNEDECVIYAPTNTTNTQLLSRHSIVE